MEVFRSCLPARSSLATHELTSSLLAHVHAQITFNEGLDADALERPLPDPELSDLNDDGLDTRSLVWKDKAIAFVNSWSL